MLCCGGGRVDAAVSRLFFMFPFGGSSSLIALFTLFFIYIFIYLRFFLPAIWLHLNHLSVFPFFFFRPKMQISRRLDSGDLTDECNTHVFDPSTSSVVFRLFIYSFGFFFSFLCGSSGAQSQPRLTGDFKDVSALFIFIYLFFCTIRRLTSEILTDVDSQMIVDVFR